jgi:hypothetical protein
MTGTALENKVEEMITLIRMLQPKIASSVHGMEFLSTAPQFREKVAPVYYRRKREDVLTELPELIETKEWCSMNPVEEVAYENAVLYDSFPAARRVSWNVDDLKNSSKAMRMMEKEVKLCDGIIYTLDARAPFACLNTTLEPLFNNKPVVYLLNKADLVPNPIFLPKVDKDSIVVSNKTKEGFDELLTYIKGKLFANTIKSKFLIPYQNGEVFNIFKEKGNIHSFTYENEGILVDVTLSNHLYNLYKKYEKPEN